MVQMTDPMLDPKTDPNHRAVRLRNGAEEFYPLVAMHILVLRDMMEGKGWKIGQPLPAVVLYELVAKARDHSHRIFDAKIGEQLVSYKMFEDADGRMHGSTRNIVVSAFDGSELMDLRLVNPLHGSERKNT